MHRIDHLRDLTKVIACIAILLSVGTAQAEPKSDGSLWLAIPPREGGEPTKIGDGIKDCLMWFDVDSGFQFEGKGCQPYLQKPGCYKRMQEAMTEMEKSLALESNQKNRKQPVWMIPDLLKPSSWNRVMNECVK